MLNNYSRKISEEVTTQEVTKWQILENIPSPF